MIKITNKISLSLMKINLNLLKLIQAIYKETHKSYIAKIQAQVSIKCALFETVINKKAHYKIFHSQILKVPSSKLQNKQISTIMQDGKQEKDRIFTMQFNSIVKQYNQIPGISKLILIVALLMIELAKLEKQLLIILKL